MYLIHYHFTDQEPLKLQHIEETLVNEFEELYGAYREIYQQREAFINMKCVLHYLLKKHNVHVEIEFRRSTKQIQILETLFNKLGWTFSV